MNEKESLTQQTADIVVSTASSLVGFAIGGPIGAVIGGVATPTTKLAYQVIKSWSDRRASRITRIVGKAFEKSGKSVDQILNELMVDTEWSDVMLSMIRQLIDTDPELDEVFSTLMASAIRTDDSHERKRLIVLNTSIKGLNRVQLQIIRGIYNSGGKLSASSISKYVDLPELELRNAVRDLELRGIIIDDGTEPTVWNLRELGLAIVKAINDLEEK